MEPKQIIYNGEVLAIFYSHEINANGGIRFLTPENYPIQIGLIEHKNGKKVLPHIHRDLRYNVNTTQEFIYIEKGHDVVITIFSKDWQEAEKLVLSSGDSILFVGGGHSLDIPADCRIFEVKQGPYPGDKIAKIFKD